MVGRWRAIMSNMSTVNEDSLGAVVACRLLRVALCTLARCLESPSPRPLPSAPLHLVPVSPSSFIPLSACTHSERRLTDLPCPAWRTSNSQRPDVSTFLPRHPQRPTAPHPQPCSPFASYSVAPPATSLPTWTPSTQPSPPNQWTNASAVQRGVRGVRVSAVPR